jgi:hypothetical protein
MFTVFAGVHVGPQYLQSTLKFLSTSATSWSTKLSKDAGDTLNRYMVQAGLLALPALSIAAMCRSARVSSWRPLLITVLAALGGLLCVPILSWLGEAAVVAWRGASYVARFVAWLISWLIPIGLVVIAVALIVGALAVLYQIGRYIQREHRWFATVLAILAIGVVLVAVRLGWLDSFAEWLGNILAIVGHWISAIAQWVGNILSPIIVVIIRIFFVLVVFLLIIGFAVAFFGQAGRTVFLPLISASGAGGAQGKCADLAAGAGVTISLMLTGAVLDPVFQPRFLSAWTTAPGFHHLPAPLHLYDFLLPGAAEGFIRPAFTGYVPTIDVGLLLVVAVIGVFSLLFHPTRWTNERESLIALPIMIAVGGAIALALVIILLTLWAKAQS